MNARGMKRGRKSADFPMSQKVDHGRRGGLGEEEFTATALRVGVVLGRGGRPLQARTGARIL